MGGDSFPNVRSPNRHMLGGYAHLPDNEGVCIKMIKFGFLLLLYQILQVIHCLTFSDVNGEGTVGTVENPTEEGELII
jgi:hypothetical protein